MSRKKRPPSEVKWLTCKRARILGELERSAEYLVELRQDIAKRTTVLARLQKQETATVAAQAELQKKLAALDQTLAQCTSPGNPNDAKPVQAWAGKYGKRGALTDAIVRVLRTRGATGTGDLQRLVEAELGVVHLSPVERKRWRAHTFVSRVRAMGESGQLIRVGKAGTSGCAPILWALPGQKRPPTLAQLRVQAADIEAKRRGRA